MTQKRRGEKNGGARKKFIIIINGSTRFRFKNIKIIFWQVFFQKRGAVFIVERERRRKKQQKKALKNSFCYGI